MHKSGRSISLSFKCRVEMVNTGAEIRESWRWERRICRLTNAEVEHAWTDKGLLTDKAKGAVYMDGRSLWCYRCTRVGIEQFLLCEK